MHPNKASGPDGFPASFFQYLWPSLERPVSNAVLRVLNNEEDITPWNSTLIVLIPKVCEPREVKDFRPISLCLQHNLQDANRIRRVLNSVIDEPQSAFVPGRMISDNIIIGYECMHRIRSFRKGKRAFAALKLDMSKAYDRIEWPHLRAVLTAMRFPPKITEILMKCVESVSYSFKINGKLLVAVSDKGTLYRHYFLSCALKGCLLL